MKNTLQYSANFFPTTRPGAHTFPRWMIPHYLGLDAVAVAVVWQAAATRHLHTQTKWSGVLALALSVFCIYLGDRLRDSFFIDARARPRHLFVRSHRTLLVCVFLAALAAGATLAAYLVWWPVLRSGLALTPLILLYFAYTHIRGEFTEGGWLKECTVGFVFSAGVFLAPVLRAEAWNATALCMALGFAILCTLNCLAIAWYENAATSVRRYGLLALLSGAIQFAFWFAFPQERFYFSCVLLGTALLCAIVWMRRRSRNDFVAIAADFALLLAGMCAWLF